MITDTGIAVFLSARLDEEEAMAKAASEGPWDVSAVTPAWAGFKEHPLAPAAVACINDGEDYCLFVALPFGQPPERDEANVAHVARHDPARALREVEAARRILERHRDCATMTGYCRNRHVGPPPCPDLADLLYHWADHPEYRQEWKP